MSNQIFIFTLLLAASLVAAQFPKVRVCSSSRHIDNCNQLQRKSSEVVCVYAQDAIECAQRIINGTADFGAFSAENAYHIASLGLNELTVINEVRHNSRRGELYDFQSVVVVRSDHRGGIDGLKGVDFCHPGLNYDGHQKWSEGFLKHFERSVVQPKCSIDGVKLQPEEMEVKAMTEFFNAGCRPGTWSNNPDHDKFLKEKYPILCALCDNSAECKYSPSTSDHQPALNCVRKSANAVTYVALEEAQKYFNENSDITDQFSYLCQNGTLQAATTSKPCVWLRQPWKLIITSTERAIAIKTMLANWLSPTSFSSIEWRDFLLEIILDKDTQSHTIMPASNIVRVPDYVSPMRPIPVGIDTCNTAIKWCTHSFEEKEKCDVLRMVSLTTGIQPTIVCNDPKTDVVTCLSEVQAGKADFVGIDSNFGYLARHLYNLTTVLYEKTEWEKSSSVVVLIKDKDSEDIKRFEDFKDKKACFPEFGGIASIAFINTAKNRGIFKREHCEFGKLLGEYFSDSCLPGSRSLFHEHNGTNPDSLCNLCQTQYVTSTTPQPIRPMSDLVDGEEESQIEGADDDDSQNIPFIPNTSINCQANPTNRYYGTRGALSCLHELGDVAVLEAQNLVEHAKALNVNPDIFRILCRNGSLASNTGFNVDPECYLTTIVDGEIVVRKDSEKNPGIINALLSLDKYLQTDPDFKMYNIFKGEKNLLFEDSSLGLVSPHDDVPEVRNYMKLFEDVENCMRDETDGAAAAAINILLTLTLVMFTILIRN